MTVVILIILQYGEFCSRDKKDSVNSRLRGQLAFWRDILEAPEFVLSMIETGYRLPFVQYPPRCNLRNNLSALKHPDFVKKGCCSIVTQPLCNGAYYSPPFSVNPLTVAEGKKLRLVIDLGHVNQYMFRNKFKYEDLRSLSQVIEQSHWFLTWELKSGYHPVDIALEHQQYLGFSRLHTLLYFYCFTVWFE